MKVHTMPQRSEEWHAIRKTVIITASEMGVFLTKNDATSAKARLSVITKNLAEPIYADSSLSGSEFLMELRAKEEKMFEYNIPVQRGNALEPEARAMYEQRTGNAVAEVGFLTDDDGLFGCSPDGIIAEHGDLRMNPTAENIAANASWGLEIKCPIPETHMKWLLAGGLPDEHRCQVHGSMAVTGLNRWDFMSYCPGLPPLIVTVVRGSFTEEMAAGLSSLHAEYQRNGTKLKALYKEAFNGPFSVHSTPN